MAINESKKEEYFDYLDSVRQLGITNMFGAGPYLEKNFKELTSQESNTILLEWMDTFSERNKSNG